MPDKTWIDSGKSEAPKRMDKALAWIKNNRETFIGTAVIVLAALIFAVYFFVHYSDLRDTAWKNLFIAQQVGFSGHAAEAQTQLSSIETTYPNTSAYGYAILTNGDIFFAQGKYKEAEAEYSKLLTGGAKELRPFALYSLAKNKEAAGELPAAEAQYKDFLSAYPEHFLAPEVQWSLAHCYEAAGNADETKNAWEKIVLLYPETSWAAQAKARLAPPAEPAKKEPPVKAPVKH
ncbi:MAG: tetratricopeptide repeat protein [Elusimicrobia bacterium]|nr:tetratricopeptide repeat protein [Elusimicrobiota bacterium]